jgi:hypothetical protein
MAVSHCGSFNPRYGGWRVRVAFVCYLAHINEFIHMVLEADNGEFVSSGNGNDSNQVLDVIKTQKWSGNGHTICDTTAN